MRSWVDFWNAEHSIYVNERHKTLHAEAIGRDIGRHILDPASVVLDYGCGEALYAEDVSTQCGQLILCEAAARICEQLARRLMGRPNVQVMEPHAAERLPNGSIDLIVANSLLQYLKRDDLEALLDVWRGKLRPTGRLVIADVIPPDVNSLRDASALLTFAARGGFLVPAISGLVKTVLSDYSRIRKELGFSMYREAEFLALLSGHGLAAERIHPNFGHNQARMTFRAVRA